MLNQYDNQYSYILLIAMSEFDEIEKKLQDLQITPIQEQSNKVIAFHEIFKSMHKQVEIKSMVGSYYPYDYEFKDSGWGCAWRAIQSFLSCHNIHQSFDKLYNQFSKRDALMSIIKESKAYPQEVLSILQSNKWAPADLQCHWAEPFIGKIAALSFKINIKLILLNGYPVAYAPKEVFQSQVTFQKLIKILQKALKLSSVMIDDGKFALSIIGMKINPDQTVELVFADPHIKKNIDSPTAGLYSATYTRDGIQISRSYTQEQQKQQLYNVIDHLQFETKNWMILFVEG